MKTNLAISDISTSETEDRSTVGETTVFLVNLGKSEPSQDASVTVLEPGETYEVAPYHTLFIRDGVTWHKFQTGQVSADLKGPIVFTQPAPIKDIKAAASDLYAARHLVLMIPSLTFGFFITLGVLFLLTGGIALPIWAYLLTTAVWISIGLYLDFTKTHAALSRPGVIFFHESDSHTVKFSPPAV